MLLGMIFRLYSEIFVEIHAFFLEIFRFELVTLFVKHPVCAGKYFMDTLVSHRLICSNSRLKTVHVDTATRSFPLLQTPVLERDFYD